MNENNNVVTEQTEDAIESAQQEKPEFLQDGHRRPGPGMPPPPHGFGRPGDFRKPSGEGEETADGAENKGFDSQASDDADAAQGRPDFPQGGHRRPGPGMPPPPMNGQQGFGRPDGFVPSAGNGEEAAEGTESTDGEIRGESPSAGDANGFRRPPKGGRPPFGRPGERPAENAAETAADETPAETADR